MSLALKAQSCWSRATMTVSLSIEWGLFVLFAIHWCAFAALSVRKRTWRFIPALFTFTLLIVLNGLQATGMGDEALYKLLRLGAYLGLATSAALWVRRRRSNTQELDSEAA